MKDLCLIELRTGKIHSTEIVSYICFYQTLKGNVTFVANVSGRKNICIVILIFLSEYYRVSIN